MSTRVRLRILFSSSTTSFSPSQPPRSGGRARPPHELHPWPPHSVLEQHAQQCTTNLKLQDHDGAITCGNTNAPDLQKLSSHSTLVTDDSILCHVLQYECWFEEAVEFMEGCSSSSSSCSSFMLTHNWWHVALCYLEGGSPIQRVLEINDNCIWKELEKSDAVGPEAYLDAASLLLRVYVRGEIDPFEDRLKILASCLTVQANWYREWHLDSLILWALANIGELSKGEDLPKGLKSRFSRMSKKKQQLMQRVMLLAESLYECGSGNDKKALELLGPDFDANNCKMLGASEEQLDVFNEVSYSMLLNTGQAVNAIDVIEKRIKKREGVPFMWRLLERGYNLTGRKEAALVGEKAQALETAYFK